MPKCFRAEETPTSKCGSESGAHPLHSGQGGPMLKVSRREKETITLFTDNGEITISIEAIRGRQVRVGIKAPDSVEVVRSELLQK